MPAGAALARQDGARLAWAVVRDGRVLGTGRTQADALADAAWRAMRRL